MSRNDARRRTAIAAMAAVCAVLGCWQPDVDAREEAGDGSWDPLTRALGRVSGRPDVAYTSHRYLKAELLDRGEDGWMEVFARYDPRHGLHYQVLAEGGSERIRRTALLKILQKEVEASRRSDPTQSAFSTRNYRFGAREFAEGAVRVALSPLRRDARLIDGIAIVSAATATLLGVEGVLADNPSFWVRDVRVALRYASQAGATLPVRIDTRARIRLFGSARMEMTIRYLTVDGRRVDANPAQRVVRPPANPRPVG